MDFSMKVFLETIIIGKSFSSLDELENYLKSHTCTFSIDGIDSFLTYFLFYFTEKNEHMNQLIGNQLLNIWSIILINSDLNTMYDGDTKMISLLEGLRGFITFFGSTSKQLLPILNRNIKIVEVNERGLKQKHFAYDGIYSIGDYVYVQHLQLRSLGIVTDVYDATLNEIFSYFIYISPRKVYSLIFDVPKAAKECANGLMEKKYVQVRIEDDVYWCEIDFDSYVSQRIRVVDQDKGEDYLGTVVSSQIRKAKLPHDHDTLYHALSILKYPKRTYKKEYRPLNDEIMSHLIPGWTLNDLNDALRHLNRKRYIIILSVLEQIANKIEQKTSKQLNEIEEFNLYYRPYLNYLLQTVDLNSFHYGVHHIDFSILFYLTTLKQIQPNSLSFLIDQSYVIDINIVYINIDGVIRKFFAYEEEYEMGMPVLVAIENSLILGFVHYAGKIKLFELLQEIEYYECLVHLKLSSLDQYIAEASNSKGKVMLVSLMNEDKKIDVYRLKNHIPYVGERFVYENHNLVVVGTPIYVGPEEVDIENLKTIE